MEHFSNIDLEQKIEELNKSIAVKNLEIDDLNFKLQLSVEDI